jgi:hypothetical protein
VARQVVRSYSSMAVVMGGGEDRYDSFLSLVLFLVGSPSYSAKRGHVWYRVYGSLAICRCREPIVSRFLGHNRRPAVPGVQDFDNYYSNNPCGPLLQCY